VARNACGARVERGYPRFLYGDRIERVPRISNNSRGAYRGTARPVQHPKRGDALPVTAGAEGTASSALHASRRSPYSCYNSMNPALQVGALPSTSEDPDR